jgi:hypothetical protein
MNLLKTSSLCLAATLLSTAALAASLVQTATLKDFQTVGSTTKKQKHQQYDKTGQLGQADAVRCGLHAGIQGQRAKRRGHQHLGQQGEVRDCARGRFDSGSVDSGSVVPASVGLHRLQWKPDLETGAARL